MEQKRIAFLFHPNDIEHKQHAIEKSIDGKKRRYLRGIASGTQVDGHGERITSKCIKSFQEQSGRGDILLYADRHGVAFTDDIGILTESAITPMGDWEVEFRLYDEGDGVGQNTLETANKMWSQVMGLPPYKYPKQKGFSIEGYIPDNGILSMSIDGKRVIDDVILDGCVVVPRPAYKTSIAQALYKALDEVPPWKIEKANENAFKKIIATEEVQNNYYRNRYLYQDSLEEQIERIMSNEGVKEKRNSLEDLFAEYTDAMIDLILNSELAFDKLPPDSEQQAEQKADLYKNENIVFIKSMINNIDAFIQHFK